MLEKYEREKSIFLNKSLIIPISTKKRAHSTRTSTIILNIIEPPLSEKKRENCFSSRVIFAPERLSTGCDEKWETKVLLTRSERRLEDSGREAQVERSKGGALLLPSSISAQLP